VTEGSRFARDQEQIARSGTDRPIRTFEPMASEHQGGIAMCDYSLHHVASRPAKVGDKLISASFTNSITRGFAAVGEPEVAVCLLPGTELAFDREIEYEPRFHLIHPTRKSAFKVARFRWTNLDRPHAHHDALEFPDGQVVLLTRVTPGQAATILQLPVGDAPARRHEAEIPTVLSV
jgi:hypothetical protein